MKPEKINTDKLDFSNTKVAFEQHSKASLRKTYLIFAVMNQNWMVKIGTFFINWSLKVGFPIKKLIKTTIFSHFCGGENISECDKTINSLYNYQIGTILDYSVEGENNEEVFEETKNEILKTVRYSADRKEKIPFCVFKVSGLTKNSLLEKMSSSNSVFSDEEVINIEKFKNRVNEIVSLAAKLQIRLFFDAEETWIQPAIDNLALDFMKVHNIDNNVVVYNTYQLYRKKGLNILKSHYKNALDSGYKVGAKLVRGAYMEKERERALDLGYESPINETKEITDIEFNKALEFCIENIDLIYFCLGTHNEISSKLCIELMTKKRIKSDDKRIFFAQLLGMSDNISFNLSNHGFNVAKYVPYGPLEAVLPYLFRRASENTSIAGQSSREFLLVQKELKRRV